MEGGSEHIYITQDAIPDELCKMKWKTEEFHFFLPPFLRRSPPPAFPGMLSSASPWGRSTAICFMQQKQ